MIINVKATNLELTPEIQAYLDKRMEAVTDFVDKHAPAAVCDVEVGKTTTGQRHGGIFRAEINLEMDGVFFRASSEEESIEAAIDEVKREILRELRSKKDKDVHLRRRGGSRLKEITQTLSESGTRLKSYIIRDRKRK